MDWGKIIMLHSWVSSGWSYFIFQYMALDMFDKKFPSFSEWKKDKYSIFPRETGINIEEIWLTFSTEHFFAAFIFAQYGSLKLLKLQFSLTHSLCHWITSISYQFLQVSHNTHLHFHLKQFISCHNSKSTNQESRSLPPPHTAALYFLQSCYQRLLPVVSKTFSISELLTMPSSCSGHGLLHFLRWLTEVWGMDDKWRLLRLSWSPLTWMCVTGQWDEAWLVGR